MSTSYHSGIECKEKIEISVADNKNATSIRTFVCNIARSNPNYKESVLCITDLNEFIDGLAQDAFNFGYDIAKQKYETL